MLHSRSPCGNLLTSVSLLDQVVWIKADAPAITFGRAQSSDNTGHIPVQITQEDLQIVPWHDSFIIEYPLATVIHLLSRTVLSPTPRFLSAVSVNGSGIG